MTSSGSWWWAVGSASPVQSPVLTHSWLPTSSTRASGYSLADIAQRHHVPAPAGLPLADATSTPEEAAAVATAVLAVAGPMREALEAAGLSDLFTSVEMPLVAVLADMELRGVRVDTPTLARLSQTYAVRLAGLEDEITQLAGHPFLISSPVQVRQVLFDELGLPVIKRTKTGPSTDAEVLEELADRHPLPRKLLEHRQFSKLKSTYVDSLPQLVDPSTGRIHASFNQTVTATGRLSSSNPNLQNIPVRTREGREIRAAFLPCESGWRFVAADYSQIELRVLAHLSGDAAMRSAFEAGDDIHTRTAMAVFSESADAITAEMRRAAKAVNFGILYGQSGFGLAKSLSITQLEASAFIETYFRTFAGGILHRHRPRRLPPRWRCDHPPGPSANDRGRAAAGSPSQGLRRLRAPRFLSGPRSTPLSRAQRPI